MESVISIIATHLCVRDKLNTRLICKMANEEFFPHVLTHESNYLLVRRIFNLMRQIKTNKKIKINNSFRRRLHSSEDPIILF